MNKQLNTEEMPLTTENMEFARVTLHPNIVFMMIFSRYFNNKCK